MPYLAGLYAGQAARDMVEFYHLNYVGDLERVERMEHVASLFNDLGEDWNEIVLYDASGTEIYREHTRGY